jgi:hypothetical protein
VLAPRTLHAGSLRASRSWAGRIGGESLVPGTGGVKDGQEVGMTRPKQPDDVERAAETRYSRPEAATSRA